MTVVELSIALAITGLIGAAVCSFTFATGTAWRSNEAGITAEQLANLTSIRVNNAVQTGRLFGAYSSGNIDDPSQPPYAALMIWTRDRNADGRIQTSEILLLEFDPVNSRLNAWMKPAPKIDETWTYAAFTASSAVDTMKFRSNRYTLISGLTAAQFALQTGGGANGRPTLAYQFRTQVGGTVESFTGAAAIRAPSAIPQ